MKEEYQCILLAHDKLIIDRDKGMGIEFSIVTNEGTATVIISESDIMNIHSQLSDMINEYKLKLKLNGGQIK